MAGKSISSSLSYLNSLLGTLGIKRFPAHHLLLAAANDPSATTPVLSFLSDLVVFHLAFAPQCNNSPPPSPCMELDEYNNGQTAASSNAGEKKIDHKHHRFGNIIHGPWAMDHLDVMPMPDASSTSQEERLCFVKFYFVLWGYAPGSPFFTLDSETGESRQLLLALGWLLCHCDVFSRALEKRFSLILEKTPVITNTYLDASAMARGREAMAEAKQYVAKVIATANSLGESSRAKVKAQAEQLLMMCGHLRMTLKSLYALISCKTKQSHDLNHMQVLENVRGPEGNPFSPFELHLLEHQKTLEKYLMTLETAQHMIKELVECNQQERIFWQWMGEVAAEARQEKHIKKLDQQLSTTTRAFETSLLPILTYFQDTLNDKCSAQEPSHQGRAPSSKENNNANTVASQADVLSTPNMTMWNNIEESRPPARLMSYLGKSKDNKNANFLGIFSSLHRHLLLQEESYKSQNIRSLKSKQVKSVKDIATMLVSELAKIRMKNKVIIQEALEISMTNKDHLFAGV
ncbi:unnamed protein product [Calypogeia fissa]